MVYDSVAASNAAIMLVPDAPGSFAANSSAGDAN
jgi:hypothetical protein